MALEDFAMFDKLRSYDAAKPPCLPFSVLVNPFQPQQFQVNQVIEQTPQLIEDTVSSEVRNQEKQELNKWLRGVQTHNRLRALVAVQQSAALRTQTGFWVASGA